MFRILSSYKLPSLWMPVWASWQSSPPSHAIAYGESKITALETGYLETGEPVLLVGRSDGSVQLWVASDWSSGGPQASTTCANSRWPIPPKVHSLSLLGSMSGSERWMSSR